MMRIAGARALNIGSRERPFHILIAIYGLVAPIVCDLETMT